MQRLHLDRMSGWGSMGARGQRSMLMHLRVVTAVALHWRSRQGLVLLVGQLSLLLLLLRRNGARIVRHGEASERCERECGDGGCEVKEATRRRRWTSQVQTNKCHCQKHTHATSTSSTSHSAHKREESAVVAASQRDLSARGGACAGSVQALRRDEAGRRHQSLSATAASVALLQVCHGVSKAGAFVAASSV